MSTKKILLVDDSCTARLVNRMIFSQKSNYVLISAVDGKEAVERLRRDAESKLLKRIPRCTPERKSSACGCSSSPCANRLNGIISSSCASTPPARGLFRASKQATFLTPLLKSSPI